MKSIVDELAMSSAVALYKLLRNSVASLRFGADEVVYAKEVIEQLHWHPAKVLSIESDDHVFVQWNDCSQSKIHHCLLQKFKNNRRRKASSIAEAEPPSSVGGFAR